MTPIALFWQIFGCALATMFLSYLWFGDTYAYSIAERFFVAGTVVFTCFEAFKSLRGSLGNVGMEPWLIIPAIIGLLAFTRLTKFRWAARYPVAILSGVGLGIAFGLTIRSSIINFAVKTVRALLSGSPDAFSGILFFVGGVTTLTYFLYSRKYSAVFHSTTGKLYYVMRIGRLFMMASFGWLMRGIGPSQFQDYIVVVVRRTIQAVMSFIGA